MTAITTRENVEVKGRRYLVEGRVRVLLVHRGRIFAEVRGTEQIWHAGLDNGQWFCDCPSRRRCSHLVALQLVVTQPDVTT